MSMRGVPLTTKERILQAIEALPAETTFEQAIEKLRLLADLERRLHDLDEGRGVPHEEAVRRLGRSLS